MFFHNTRYHFKLAEQSPDLAGGIVGASAMIRPQLVQRIRKSVREYPYLQHRLFDPQLYLSDIDPNVASGVVTKLATYPWFRCAHDEYVSDAHPGGVARWKEEQAAKLLAAWPRQAASSPADIDACARAAVEFQLAFGCEKILLPSPLTHVPGTYAMEAQWIDAGLAVCRALRVTMPIYATVALSDIALRQQNPRSSPFLQAIAAQIAARTPLAGAYLVVAQESIDDGYNCKVTDTLLSILLLTDDLVRGAGKDVIVNYMGTFGALATAAGASIWASGYYRSQRRLRLSDMDDQMGRQYPRYFSVGMLGDVGVEEDLDLVAAHAVRDRVLTDSPTAAALNKVLRAGGRTADVPEWEYSMTNIAAASAHYNTVMHLLGHALHSLSSERRIEVVNRVLVHAEGVAAQVTQALTANGRKLSPQAELITAGVWRRVFEEWRQSAGV